MKIRSTRTIERIEIYYREDERLAALDFLFNNDYIYVSNYLVYSGPGKSEDKYGVKPYEKYYIVIGEKEIE